MIVLTSGIFRIFRVFRVCGFFRAGGVFHCHILHRIRRTFLLTSKPVHNRIYQITGHAQNQDQEQYDDHDQDPGAVILFPAIIVEAACSRILPDRSRWIR